MTKIFNKSIIDKEKLRQIILKNPQSLIEGMNFIDLQLDAGDHGIIEFLGIDSNGRMILINFDVNPNDSMLLDLLAQSQWIKSNQSLIKRLFFSENVDFKQPQELVLVCPVFSGKTMAAAKQLGKNIRLIRYNYIVSNDDDAIIFDEVYSSVDSFSVKDNKPPAEKKTVDFLKPEIVKKQHISGSRAESKEQKTEPEKDKEERLELPDYNMVSLTPEEIAEFMDFRMPVEQESTE